jgi:hypothetical protein
MSNIIPASPEHAENLYKAHFVYEALLNHFPVAVRRKIECLRGLSTDQLAELLIAQAKGVLAVDGVGHDFSDGSEGKFSCVDKTIQKDTKSSGIYYYDKYKAKIGNLNTKTGDLHIIVADTRTVGTVLVRFFSIPFNVWRTKIPGNTFTMDLTKTTHKWYMNYEMNRKEFGL